MEQSLLGKKTTYNHQYDPTLLFPIARSLNREKIQVSHPLPFVGRDIWNHYEVSWLDKRGKPIVALAALDYDCQSPYIIESKSMKLYFNSFNNTQIADVEDLKRTIQQDIEARIQAPLNIHITPVSQFKTGAVYQGFPGFCIDDLPIDCSVYRINPEFLSVETDIVAETLCSNLMKSNCLVTGQPDWGSIFIDYHGKKIHQAGLLRYIVSYRNTHEFSETCVEKIFMDIMHHCSPNELTVYGRFNRRGGLDINPMRSTTPEKIQSMLNLRLCRQ